MPINKSTEYGNISISLDAIASLAGGTITECYGVVGMSSQKVVRDGWAELLKKENYARGVHCAPTRRWFDFRFIYYCFTRN